MKPMTEMYIAQVDHDGEDQFYVFVHPRNRVVARSLRADGHDGVAKEITAFDNRGRFIRVSQHDVARIKSSANYIGIMVVEIEMLESWVLRPEGDPEVKFEFQDAIQGTRADRLDKQIEVERMVGEGGPGAGDD